MKTLAIKKQQNKQILEEGTLDVPKKTHTFSSPPPTLLQNEVAKCNNNITITKAISHPSYCAVLFGLDQTCSKEIMTTPLNANKNYGFYSWFSNKERIENTYKPTKSMLERRNKILKFSYTCVYPCVKFHIQ